MGFREQKRAARQILHTEMKQPVLYIPMRGGAPAAASARIHLKFDALGELRRSGFAEGVELTPKAIFLVSELSPVRLSLIVTEDLGAFLLDQVDPPDDITVTARIVRLPVGKYAEWGLTQGVPWCGLTAPVA